MSDFFERKELFETADRAASEIREAFKSVSPHWDQDRPVRHTVLVPSLVGVRTDELLQHVVSYGNENLRRGSGIIVFQLTSDSGAYTGEALVQAACDDF